MAFGDKQILLKDFEKGLEDKLTVAQMRDVIDALSDVIDEFEVEFKEENHTFLDEGSICTDELDLYLEAKKVEGCSPKTIERYRYCLSRMLRYVGISPKRITVHHLRAYLLYLQEHGSSDRTVEGDRAILNGFFGWLNREGIVQVNPCANLAKVKCMKKIRHPFSDVDIERLKECCVCDRDKAIVCVLLSTGCRISELCGINRTDIDWQNKQVTVLGKGNKERIVYLDNIALMVLKRYLRSRNDYSPALFVGKGTERMTPGGIRFMLKKLEFDSEVENVHPHRFRRTLATNLISRGMPIQEVARILGHEKLDTTMTYVYVDQESVKNAYYKYS